MLANIIVGLVVMLVIGFAFVKAKNDLKNNKCSGCSACSSKSKCQIVKFN